MGVQTPGDEEGEVTQQEGGRLRGALLFPEARPLPFQSVLPPPRGAGARLKAQGTGLVGVGTALRFGRSPREAG